MLQVVRDGDVRASVKKATWDPCEGVIPQGAMLHEGHRFFLMVEHWFELFKAPKGVPLQWNVAIIIDDSENSENEINDDMNLTNTRGPLLNRMEAVEEEGIRCNERIQPIAHTLE
jgi:hypothetical protein